MISQPQILDNFKFFAGADVARSAGATAGTVVSPGILAQGEIVVTDASNRILDTATVLTADSIKLVMGRGANEELWQSQVFTSDDILRYVGREYQAKVQQVSYYGYNAATNTGAIDAINDNYYTGVISFYELASQEASALMAPVLFDYLSDGSATQPEVTNGLYKQAVRQISYWTRRPVLIEMVASAAGQATNDAAAVLTQGSSLVTNAPNLATTVGIVGDYIRVGSQSNDLDEVYLITATDGVSTLTLDTAFQETSTTSLIHQVLDTDVLAGDMGIRVTGLNQPFILDSRPYSLVTFQLGIKNAGSTPLTTAVDAFIGHGTYEQMRTLEASSWRNQGQIFTYTEFPPTTVQTDLVTTENHSTLELVLSKPNRALTNTDFRAQLCVACALDGNVANTFDTSYVGAATSTVDVLDTYISNFTNFTAQAGNL